MKKLIYVVICFLLAAPSFALTGISGGVKGGLINGYDQPGLEISNYKTEQITKDARSFF
ncbi:MAG: hypothetical protein NTV06_01635 [candidate division Zixibacteria bacterium]|nr:hypothetical protein [candidate division Zixibacteria bacterium]